MKPILLVALIGMLASSISTPAQAGEIEEKIGRAALSEYAKEQLKFQLAEFVNKNPQLVFSTNPEIGTAGMKFLARAMAAYGFLTAKTDRDRAWSATYLVLSPEPTTAACLIAVQLVDTLMTLRAQQDLARIYEEITRIQAQTVEIMTKVYTFEFEAQKRVLSDFDRTLEQIQTISKELMSHPVYKTLMSDDKEAPSPSQEEVEEALRLLSELSLRLSNLEMQSIWIEATIDPKVMGLPDHLTSDCVSLNRKYDPLRKQLTALQSAFGYFFASTNANRLKRKVEEDLKPYVTQLRIYKRCVTLINSVSTEAFWQSRRPDFDESEFVHQCETRFALRSQTDQPTSAGVLP